MRGKGTPILKILLEAYVYDMNHVFSDLVSHMLQSGEPATLMCSIPSNSGFSLGLFQRALCPLGALMCPLGLPQNQQCALWLHLKTIIFLTAT